MIPASCGVNRIATTEGVLSDDVGWYERVTLIGEIAVGRTADKPAVA
jgi:hypothetical protein